MLTGRIVFIDAYDSFTNSIIALLKDRLAVSVDIVNIDDARFRLNDNAFLRFLEDFDAVVAGPGPGHPAQAKDVGLIERVWHLSDEHLLPVLGICLGFQSLALALGANIERLRQPRHGLVTPITHCGRDIFTKTDSFKATQYHSLFANIEHGEHARGTVDLWRALRPCRELVPLAWDLSDSVNGPILMAARHCHKPFWGVQYHPESICTDDEGRKLIDNWWLEVCAWYELRPRAKPRSTKQISGTDSAGITDEIRSCENPGTARTSVQCRSFPLPELTDVTDLVDILRQDCQNHEPILFESGVRNSKPVNAETGRFSIIGLHDMASTHIRYSCGDHRLEVKANGETMISRRATISDVFRFLEDFVKRRQSFSGPSEVPFWGGLAGFLSYEAGLETINVASGKVCGDRPDMWFIFVQRSVVVDHVDGIVHVQSIQGGCDDHWITSVQERTLRHAKSKPCRSGRTTGARKAGKVMSSPTEKDYCSKVRVCQSHLRAGSSYELCLTDQTLLELDTDAWSLYRRLRGHNPAPFSAYIRLTSTTLEPPSRQPGIHIISSSPERFFSWSRQGECQFRPIKGTVKKVPGMKRADAEKLLGSPKECAENLMIVDLIRHDLNGVKSVQNVGVPKLMSVEEYETVYQLVSVIKSDSSPEFSGVAALAASLPPGSMTGAPKRRSCELLREIEGIQNFRGIYSGVIGYFDVGGGGDFSVVIRAASKWDDEVSWRVGAGGAVTVLSDPEAEWEEMLAKREGVLQAFG